MEEQKEKQSSTPMPDVALYQKMASRETHGGGFRELPLAVSAMVSYSKVFAWKRDSGW